MTFPYTQPPWFLTEWQLGSGDPAPTLFAGSPPSQLLPVTQDEEGAGHLHLTQETVKKEWEVTLSAANFATALRQWYKRCEKFVDIARSCVEKS